MPTLRDLEPAAATGGAFQNGAFPFVIECPACGRPSSMCNVGYRLVATPPRAEHVPSGRSYQADLHNQCMTKIASSRTRVLP